jgi:uncharacterized protein (DUF111 family)
MFFKSSWICYNIAAVYLYYKRRMVMIGLEEHVIVLETAMDDMNPEIYSYLLEKLIKEGALDAYTAPIYMKKNRPANLLSVICREDKLEALLDIIFRESTTMGIRIREEKRRVLPRDYQAVKTPWGEVRVKIGFTGDDKKKVLQIAPEYEDCRNISAKSGVPLKKVYSAALLAYEEFKQERYR